MKIDNGKQPGRFRFLLSLRAPCWGCSETASNGASSLGPIPLELQPVPDSLPETQGVRGTSCSVVTEVGVEQQRLWDSNSGFCLNFSPLEGLGLGVSAQSPPALEH